MNHRFLPVTREEMEERGWEQADFVYVIGDAYVDHPSFGPAVISRVLEAHGYRVAILSQPNWRDETSIQIFGRPRLGFLVSSGNMDSMVNHYTAAKKHRGSDAYTPGGASGKRPDYAVTVYCQFIRRVYKNVPIIAGGIEASLRRLAHYDYWSDKLKHSVLIDSGADLISYGMGERSIVAIAEALAAGIPVREITFIRGTVYKCKELPEGAEILRLPDFEELSRDKLRTMAAAWRSGMRIFLWFRIRPANRLRLRRWTMSMLCPLNEPIIRPIRPWGVFRLSLKCDSV